MRFIIQARRRLKSHRRLMARLENGHGVGSMQPRPFDLVWSDATDLTSRAARSAPNPAIAAIICLDPRDFKRLSLTLITKQAPPQLELKAAPLLLLLAQRLGNNAIPIDNRSGYGPTCQGTPATSFGLFMADPRQGGLASLMGVDVPTHRDRRGNHGRLIDACADYLSLWMAESQQRGWPGSLAPGPAVSGIRPAPLALGASALYPLRRLKRQLQERLWHWRSDSIWTIGVSWRDPAAGRISKPHRLPAPPARWFADPFPWTEAGQSYLFCEEFPECEQRGRISLFSLDRERGAVYRGTAIEEAFHLSFPRLFRHGGRLWATVESGTNGDVRLYECLDFPHRWQLRRQLLKGGSWADPLLFEHEGLWYLLVSTTSSSSFPRAVAPELHLFCSPDLLTAPFRPHPQSPLVFSSLSGRNGGLLRTDTGLIRVSQRTGFSGNYGEAIAFHQITTLSADAYEERTIQLPWVEELIHGLAARNMHTFNNEADLLVFDFIPAG